MDYNQEHQDTEDTETTAKKCRKFSAKQITAFALSFILLCGSAIGGVWLARSFTVGHRDTSLMQLSVATTPANTVPFSTPATATTPNSGYAALVNGPEAGQMMTASEIYARYIGSIVGIVTEGTTKNVFGQESLYASGGTGFVITSDGYIVTNCHVVDGGNTFTVSFEDGRYYDAKLIGAYAANDIALLKIEAEDLTPVAIGNSSTICVGEDIVTIGNPLGELTFSLTRGVVSALNRLITTDVSASNYMFQHDAAVNPGNSGGPVFNSYGQVIGVVTAKYAETGTEGLGFALPINNVMRIVSEFLENGTLRNASFGITVSDMIYAENESDSNILGAWIAGVEAGSAAANAGMLAGDIVTKLDDMRVNSVNELKFALKSFFAGDNAVVTVVRDGETIALNIVFDEAEADGTQEEPVPSEQPQQTMPAFPENGGYPDGWY